MVLHDHTLKAALLVAVTLALSACGKQDEQPAPPTSTAASGPTFPTGNGDKQMTLADCDKLSNPKTADDSAAGRAAAVAQGQSARAACKKEVTAQQDKPNADLARIREIKEKEQADLANRKISEQEWGKRLNEGANKPIKEYKY
jgi:hypothetical protein